MDDQDLGDCELASASSRSSSRRKSDGGSAYTLPSDPRWQTTLNKISGDLEKNAKADKEWRKQQEKKQDGLQRALTARIESIEATQPTVVDILNAVKTEFNSNKPRSTMSSPPASQACTDREVIKLALDAVRQTASESAEAQRKQGVEMLHETATGMRLMHSDTFGVTLGHFNLHAQTMAGAQTFQVQAQNGRGASWALVLCFPSRSPFSACNAIYGTILFAGAKFPRFPKLRPWPPWQAPSGKPSPACSSTSTSKCRMTMIF